MSKLVSIEVDRDTMLLLLDRMQFPHTTMGESQKLRDLHVDIRGQLLRPDSNLTDTVAGLRFQAQQSNERLNTLARKYIELEKRVAANEQGMTRINEVADEWEEMNNVVETVFKVIRQQT